MIVSVQPAKPGELRLKRLVHEECSSSARKTKRKKYEDSDHRKKYKMSQIGQGACAESVLPLKQHETVSKEKPNKEA